MPTCTITEIDLKWVIDTSVLIDHLRGDRRAAALLSETAQAGHELWSVTVVRTEVLAGMRRGEERATWALLHVLQWQDVTSEIADRAGEYARRYMASHSGVDTIDYVIAATAHLLEGRLVTQNVRHYPMFPGLVRAYG